MPENSQSALKNQSVQQWNKEKIAEAEKSLVKSALQLKHRKDLQEGVAYPCASMMCKFSQSRKNSCVYQAFEVTLDDNEAPPIIDPSIQVFNRSRKMSSSIYSINEFNQ